MAYSPTGNHIFPADFQIISSAWHARAVRVSLDQDYRLSTARKYGPNYAARIDSVIASAEQSGIYVILDRHLSDAGDLSGAHNGQQVMADLNSITFWQQIAACYGNRPSVLFELYNEPHEIPCSIWQNSGTVGTFVAAGMQQLYDAVSSAQNIVLIGGLNLAYDLSGVPTHRIVGTNIYSMHPYDFPGKQPANWDAGLGFLTATDPVVATEFGQWDCGTSYVSALINYMDAHGMSWTAWEWYPGDCKNPRLLSDWNGTPVGGIGVVVQQALLSY